jgi:adrenodoxin-NADP+ reductase
MKASRTHRRVFDLLQKAALKPPPAGATKELEWMFFRSPVSFYAAEDEQGKRRVGGVRFEKTRLEGESFGTSRAAGSEDNTQRK